MRDGIGNKVSYLFCRCKQYFVNISFSLLKMIKLYSIISTKELVKRLISSIFILYHKYEKMEKTALDRYEEIVTDALRYCTAKLRKSFKSAFILVMILYMEVI